MIPVTSSILRQLWAVIEETHSGLLLKLNDTELMQQLLQQLTNQKQLSGEEVVSISDYIYSRLPLIRDLANSRLESES
ncbi:MAG: hypothetical protein HC908_07115 [Calothrix sp. SM1_7_51]|nr:hypothetical protein [Calothrix sp. SM1_7_51]